MINPEPPDFTLLMDTLRLLLLENLGPDAAFLNKTLGGEGFEVMQAIVRDQQSLRNLIAEYNPDAILTGNRPSGYDAEQALAFLKEHNINIPLLILTGANQELRIGSLIKQGAHECVPINDLGQLPVALRVAINGFTNAHPGQRPADSQQDASFFNEVAALSNFGCWESDLVSREERWSDTQYHILGFTVGEIMPSLENLLRRVHPEDVVQVTNKISMAIEQLFKQKFDCRVICKDGNIKYVAVDMAVARDEQGLPVRIYGCSKDITEERMAVLSEKSISASLVERVKDLEQFAYIISHNLRGPVANIVSVSDTLQDDTLTPEETKDFLGALSTSVKKLDTVITDLNQIIQVRKQAGDQMEPVNFAQLVDEIKSSINVFLQEECLMILTDFKEAEDMLTVKSYMRSIFYNLISNSIKYRRPDIAPVIEIKSHRHNNKLQLNFKDNSIGIDLQKKSDQVFGLYKRFHPEYAEGKGMGLYMVKTQVETLGGKISVKSRVNEGTEFNMEFDLASQII